MAPSHGTHPPRGVGAILRLLCFKGPNQTLRPAAASPIRPHPAVPGRLGIVGSSLIHRVQGYPFQRRPLVIEKKEMAVKADELRGKSPDQLRDNLVALKKEAFNLRFQQATGQLENTSRMRAVRRDVARIKTVLNQKAAEAAAN